MPLQFQITLRHVAVVVILAVVAVVAAAVAAAVTADAASVVSCNSLSGDDWVLQFGRRNGKYQF